MKVRFLLDESELLSSRSSLFLFSELKRCT
jgi:hypothetical protein